MQCGRAARIDRQVVDEARNARVVPRLAEIAPDFGERLRAQVPAHERQRVDELHQAVGQHDEERCGVLQAIAQLLEQSHFVEMDAHAAAILVGLRAQDVEELGVLLFRWRDDAQVFTAFPVYIVRPV